MAVATRVRPAARRTIIKKMRARRAAFATRLAGLLREFFKQQAHRVTLRLLSEEHLHNWEYKALRPPADQLIPPEEDRLLSLALKPMLEQGVLSSADMAAMLINGVLKPSSYSAGVTRVLERSGSRIVQINGATRNAIQGALTQGNVQGYSLYQLAHGVPSDGFRGIESMVTELYRGRAEAIARTEMGTAMQEASQAQWREMGVAQQEIIDGEEFDDECAERNGQVVSIEEDVELNHPNCTVVTVPVIGEGGAPEELPTDTGGGGIEAPLAEYQDVTQMGINGEELIQSSLTADEIEAYQQYQDGTAFQLNDYLRTGEATGGLQSQFMDPLTVGQLDQQVAQLDAAIARGTLQQDAVVYRGMSGEEIVAAAREGASWEFMDKGFVSTSLSDAIATNYGSVLIDGEWSRPFIAEIHLPKGVNAIGNTSVGNREVTLARGSSFRVIGYREQLGPYVGRERRVDRVVILEYLP